MATLLRVYSVLIDSAGYITYKGFSASDMGVLRDRMNLRSTVLVEEVHEALAADASVRRVLVSREVLQPFGRVDLDCQATVGRRRYYDITDLEVQRHLWGGLDYPSRSQREEEVRQRNINILSWLYSLLGVSFPGPINGKRYVTGLHEHPGGKKSIWCYWDEIIWEGPGWYLVTDRVGTDDCPMETVRVAERHGGDVRVWPESVDADDRIYLWWANEPFLGYAGKGDVVLLVDENGEVLR